MLELLVHFRKDMIKERENGNSLGSTDAAKKIKAKAPHVEIQALTFVGSQNGFEVIAES